MATGEVYHIFNKSIAGFEIFNYEEDFLRIKQMMFYYRMKNTPMRFSNFLHSHQVKTHGFIHHVQELRDPAQDHVEILAYCIMPTHFHLILKQLRNNGITKFTSNISNSYSRYFNLKRKRKGPLWVGRFKNVRVQNNEQLLHLTRYIHLNPVTAGIVKFPEGWNASSYGEYTAPLDQELKICSYKDTLDIEPTQYKIFVKDGIEYQKEMARIKSLFPEEPILHSRSAKW